MIFFNCHILKPKSYIFTNNLCNNNVNIYIYILYFIQYLDVCGWVYKYKTVMHTTQTSIMQTKTFIFNAINRLTALIGSQHQTNVCTDSPKDIKMNASLVL